MLLREQHLAAWRVNWDDKAANLRALALELNLSLGHLLFLDDSPHERAWVRSQIPELVVPDLPEDPARWADWIATLPTLTVLQRTAEDTRRTEQYREQRAREEFRQSTGSMENVLRGLGLRVTIDTVRDGTFPRVAQLLAKTNQFNLTTRRHDEVTLRRRVAEGWKVYTMQVTDTFGDFGLTGVAIAVPHGDAWHLDSFLMSCRVIGKSVETALLARIAADARGAGARTLTAEFIDSGRNEPARSFLADHGFTPRTDGWLERSLADGGPAWPEWIDPVRSPEPSP
jgi:FkbH-like protein